MRKRNSKPVRDLSKLPPNAALRIPEVAEYFGVSSVTVQTLIRNNKLPHTRVSSERRVLLGDAQAYLQRNRIEAGAS